VRTACSPSEGHPASTDKSTDREARLLLQEYVNRTDWLRWFNPITPHMALSFSGRMPVLP